MFKGRFAENIWFVGEKHCLVEIGGDVINVGQTNKLQEKICLLSQWKTGVSKNGLRAMTISCRLCSFFFFKMPLTPLPPLGFEHLVEFFLLTDWGALCTALRLDKKGIDLRKLCQIYPKINTILPFKSLFVSILSKFFVNLMSILC